MEKPKAQRGKVICPINIAPKLWFDPYVWPSSPLRRRAQSQQQPPQASHLCKTTQHVLPGDPHVVHFQEAIVNVLKAHLGPNIPNGDS